MVAMAVAVVVVVVLAVMVAAAVARLATLAVVMDIYQEIARKEANVTIAVNLVTFLGTAKRKPVKSAMLVVRKVISPETVLRRRRTNNNLFR